MIHTKYNVVLNYIEDKNKYLMGNIDIELLLLVIKLCQHN